MASCIQPVSEGSNKTARSYTHFSFHGTRQYPSHGGFVRTMSVFAL